MGDHDDARITFMGHFGKQFHHLAATVAVERGSGFVGQDQARFIGQRPCHGNALLLAAGERIGQVVGAVADAQIVKQLHRPLPCNACGCVIDFQRDLHILQGGKKRNQIGLLEYEAEMMSSEGAQVNLRVFTVHDQFTADDDSPRGRRIDECHCREQRGFTGAAWAQQRDDFATGDAECHVVQGDNLGLTVTIDLSQADGLDGRVLDR